MEMKVKVERKCPKNGMRCTENTEMKGRLQLVLVLPAATTNIASTISHSNCNCCGLYVAVDVGEVCTVIMCCPFW